MSRQNAYDNPDLFEKFKQIRANEVNFNDLIETPVMNKLLPDLTGKTVLDIGCGMGQHAKQYSDMGAKSVLGIDISEKMLNAAREHFSADNIEYRQLPMEELETLSETYDVITSSLVFDYIEDFDALMASIYQLTHAESEFIFSMSHPIATAYDGTIPRWTFKENGVKEYANLHHYAVEGEKKIPWIVEGVINYHRTFSSIVNALTKAGFVIKECEESLASEELREQYPEIFGGTIHRPDFIFFKCGRG